MRCVPGTAALPPQLTQQYQALGAQKAPSIAAPAAVRENDNSGRIKEQAGWGQKVI
jgi:hypothetical protein